MSSFANPRRRIRSLQALGYVVYTTRTGAYSIEFPALRRAEENRVVAVLDVRMAETNTLLVEYLDITKDPRTPAQGRPLPSDILLGFWKYHVGLAWSALGKIVFRRVREYYLCDMLPSLYRRIQRGGVPLLAFPILTGPPAPFCRGEGDIFGNAIANTPLGALVASMMTAYREEVGGIETFLITPLIDLPRLRRERGMRADQQLSERDIVGNFDLEVSVGPPFTQSSNQNDGDSSSYCSEEEENSDCIEVMLVR